MSIRKTTVAILVLMLVSIAFITLSGFDYSRQSILLDGISDGGLGKYRIPSIDNPGFLTVAEAEQSQMRNEDSVHGFFHNGKASLYSHQNFKMA